MKQFRFRKSSRLRKRQEFVLLSQQGHHFKGKVLYISWKETQLPTIRLGITVTKKYGNAVQRNRFKRLSREAFRCSCPKEIQGVDCAVRPHGRLKGTTLKMPLQFQDVLGDFIAFFTSLIKLAGPPER